MGSQQITVIAWNVLRARNPTRIFSLVSSLPPDSLLLLNSTCCDADIFNACIKQSVEQRYVASCHNRQHPAGSGSSILLPLHLTPLATPAVFSNGILTSTWVKTTTPILTISLYWPPYHAPGFPDALYYSTLDTLSLLLTRAVAQNAHVILGGDLNTCLTEIDATTARAPPGPITRRLL